MLFDSIDDLAVTLLRDDPQPPQILTGTVEFEWVQGNRDGAKIIASSDGRRFLYRGQNRRWSPCTASVWRPGQPTDEPKLNWILSRVRIAEFEHLLSQHPMMDIARKNQIELDYDALAQHYGIPTFWMDITSSIEVGCFFAVARFEGDGSISRR